MQTWTLNNICRSISPESALWYLIWKKFAKISASNLRKLNNYSHIALRYANIQILNDLISSQNEMRWLRIISFCLKTFIILKWNFKHLSSLFFLSISISIWRLQRMEWYVILSWKFLINSCITHNMTSLVSKRPNVLFA